MTPERWRQVEELYHAVLESDGQTRDVLLASAETDVRREVEGLLAQEGSLPGTSEPLLPSHTVIAPGLQVGPYQVESLLGKGGMGHVYRALDTRLGRAVAIKASHEPLNPRFEREARAISALNHPNICTLYDVGPDYLVMELCEGETLAAALKRGALPLPLCLDIAVQVAEAMRAAHSKGIIHRDIKPDNIFLSVSGQVKIMDFGLALLLERSRLTVSGTILGTPSYMSPEQARSQPTDRRTDVWALGVVLFEMVAGQRPFIGRDVSTVLARILHDRPPALSRGKERVPPFLQHVVEKMLAKNPGERYQHMDDLVVDLRGLRREMPDSASQPPAMAASAVAGSTNPETEPTITLVQASERAGNQEINHVKAIAGAAALVALAALAWWRWG